MREEEMSRKKKSGRREREKGGLIAAATAYTTFFSRRHTQSSELGACPCAIPHKPAGQSGGSRGTNGGNDIAGAIK